MRGQRTILYLVVLLTVITGVSAAPSMQSLQVSPNPAVEGEPITVTYELYDPEGLGLVTTDIYIDNAVSYRISNSAPSTRFTFRETFILPDDFAGQHDVLVRADTADSYPVFGQRDLRVLADGRETTYNDAPVTGTVVRPARNYVSGTNGVAVIVDPEVPNVLQGEWLYWPITLVNSQNRPVTITLGAEEVNAWGSYRFDPAPTITVPARSETEAFLYIAVDDDAYTGLRYFDITTNYNGVQESREVGMAVLKVAEGNNMPLWAVWLVLIILVLAALIIAIAVSRRDNEEEGGDDDELITYY